jgi:predicted metal-dependent phosphoesterase TrpH
MVIIRADMHVHTNHSKDGKSSVKEVVKSALRYNLNALAITDHDTVDGSLEAIEFVEEENLSLIIVPGIEISTLNGHLLAYGIKKDVDPGMSMEETAFIVKELGGVTAVAHPFQFYRHGLLKFWIIRKVDAVEVFNSKYVVGICNYLASLLAKAYGKPGIAGSDAHNAGEVGAGITVVECFDRYIDSGTILKAILNGNVKTEGRRQKLTSYPSFSSLKKI